MTKRMGIILLVIVLSTLGLYQIAKPQNAEAAFQRSSEQLPAGLSSWSWGFVSALVDKNGATSDNFMYMFHQPGSRGGAVAFLFEVAPQTAFKSNNFASFCNDTSGSVWKPVGGDGSNVTGVYVGGMTDSTQYFDIPRDTSATPQYYRFSIKSNYDLRLNIPKGTSTPVSLPHRSTPYLIGCDESPVKPLGAVSGQTGATVLHTLNITVTEQKSSTDQTAISPLSRVAVRFLQVQNNVSSLAGTSGKEIKPTATQNPDGMAPNQWNMDQSIIGTDPTTKDPYGYQEVLTYTTSTGAKVVQSQTHNNDNNYSDSFVFYADGSPATVSSAATTQSTGIDPNAAYNKTAVANGTDSSNSCISFLRAIDLAGYVKCELGQLINQLANLVTSLFDNVPV